MSHGPEHHIEHAEHAAHASHDEFNKQVTISIAMVAAVLAAVTMLGHRAHNGTLFLQGESLRLQGEGLKLQSEAGIQHNQAANKWGQFQANNIRSHMYQSLLEQSEFATLKPDGAAALDKARARWTKQVEKYEANLPQIEKEARGFASAGEALEKKSNESLAEGAAALQKSHEVHKRSDRFDFGELGLQLGVVLCSLAILTKKRTFWFIGLLCSLAGLAIALTGVFGLFMDGSHH